MSKPTNFWLRTGVLRLYLLLFCIAVVVVANVRPTPIWDTISYASLAKEKDFENIETLHKDAFESLIADVGREKFQSMLTEHHPEFRKAMYEDVEVFEQQLNFFRTRVLFTTMVRGLYKSGIDTRRGGVIVSSITAALGFWVMAMLFFDKVRRPLIYLFPVLAMLFGVLLLARQSSPDALALLFVALSCYFFCKGPKGLLFVALPLAVAGRTDTIVWAGIFCAYLFVSRKGHLRWGAILCLIASYAVYKGSNMAAGQYEWGVLIQNAFGEPLLKPAEADGVVTVGHYVGLLATGLGKIAIETELIAAILLGLWVMGAIIARHGFMGTFKQVFQNPWVGFVALSAVYICAHFVLFPVLWFRFFVMHYLFIAFLFMSMTSVSGETPEIEEK